MEVVQKRQFITTHRHAPNGVIVLNFGMRNVVADVITHANFFLNRFRGLGVLTPRKFPISIGLAGRSYNSVGLNTALLHCETITSTQSD